MSKIPTQDAPSLADPQVQKCPFAAYARMREGGAVYRDPVTGYFIVAGYEHIRQVASRPEIFSNMTGLLGGARGDALERIAEIYLERGWLVTPTLVENDPPDHSRFRALVDTAFRPARIQAISENIAEVVRRLMAEFSERDETDFVSSFAIPLPLTVIADQLGVGRERMADFKRWSDAVMESADVNATAERRIELAYEVVEMQQFFAGELAVARENPREDILSDIAKAEVDGRALETSEALSILLQLLVAGNETTTNAIGSAMLKLVESGLETRLRADPELVSPFVEEVLRLEAPLQNLFRRALEDTEVGGVPIPKESILVLSWGAGNRDPRRFENADGITLDRPAAGRQHLTFGYGIHYCVGAPLARAELRIAFRLLLEGLRNFRLAEPVEYQPHIIARGPKRLRLRFDRA